MNKLKLLVTASLLVGGGIFALSAADGVTSAKAENVNDVSLYSFTEINSQEELISGANYIIGSYSAAISEESINGTFLTGSMNNNRLSETNDLSSATILTLEKVDDAYTMSFTDSTGTTKYISGINFNNAALNDNNSDSSSKWKVSFEDNLAVFCNVKYSDRYLQYNSSSKWFACYKQSSNQKNLKLFKVESNNISNEEYFESQATKTSIKSNGVVAGNVETYQIDLNNYQIQSGGLNLKDINNVTNYFFGDETSGWNVSFTDGGTPTRMWTDNTLRVYTDGSITFTNLNEKIYELKFSVGKNNLSITDDKNNSFKCVQGENVISFNEGTSTIKFSANGTTEIKDIIEFTVGKITASVENVSLRFGANIPLDHYVSTDVSYGVIIADGTKIDEGADLNNLYNGSTTAEDYVTYLKQKSISAYQMAFTSEEIAYVATPNSTVDLDETDPTAKYAQFALVIDDLLEHMDQTFAAVCYMEYEGQLYLMKEARHSINSVVDAYLADEETMGKLTDNSVAILNALNAM